MRTFPHCHRPLSAEINEAWNCLQTASLDKTGCSKRVTKESLAALHINRGAFGSKAPLELRVLSEA